MKANGGLVAALTAVATLASVSMPATAEDIYAGKKVSLVVGAAPGGGYDIYSRILAKYMPKYLPGAPLVIVQNMPGAGGMKAAEYIYSLAPKDGTTFGMVFPGALVEPLFDNTKKYRFVPTEFDFIGSADSGVRLCVTYHTSKIKTFEDAQKMPSSFGGSGPGSSTTDYASFLNALAGAKMKVVNGYKGSRTTLIAMERGELDGICGLDSGSFKAMKPDWFNNPKQSQMIIQTSLYPDKALEKLGVPSLWKYVSGEKRKVAELIVAQQEFHRPYIAPPGTSAPHVAALRKAFDAAMKDKGLLAEAEKAKLSIEPKNAATVEKLIKGMYASPPDLVAKARKALRG
ncbi:MAG: Bug family tripartite tricarboxylate transporter substrate binding protein [Hyphomicrobiaceae bacterium]